MEAGFLVYQTSIAFASYFLFSLETQHTIGYGSRATSEECPHAIILMCLQSIIGVLSSTCMAGIVFAKLARPKVCIYWTTESLNQDGEGGGLIYLKCLATLIS